MPRADKTDLVAGVLMIAVGAWFVVGSLDYRMGTVSRMGPGYVPFCLGIMSVLLGAGITATGFRREGGLPSVNWRPAIAVLSSIAVFALLLPRIGLLPTTTISVLVSSLAQRRESLAVTILLAVSVALMAWAVFVLLLGMPIRPLRNPF